MNLVNFILLSHSVCYEIYETIKSLFQANRCEGMTCSEHGKCEDGLCSCEEGYTGVSCQGIKMCFWKEKKVHWSELLTLPTNLINKVAFGTEISMGLSALSGLFSFYMSKAHQTCSHYQMTTGLFNFSSRSEVARWRIVPARRLWRTWHLLFWSL